VRVRMGRGEYVTDLEANVGIEERPDVVSQEGRSEHSREEHPHDGRDEPVVVGRFAVVRNAHCAQQRATET
jgi:hypothetical protein